MTKLDLKSYNTSIQDFEYFFLHHEKELLDELYDFKLLDDFSLKNIDTRKVFHKILIEKLIDEIHNSDVKLVFLIKPEIISSNREIYRYFDKSKIRREFMILFRFLMRNKFNTFIFLNKSYCDLEGVLDLTSPEINDFLSLHIFNSNKKLFSKVSTINSLTNKIFKQIKR